MEESLLCNEENVTLSSSSVVAVVAPRDESQDPIQVIRLMARREVDYGSCNAKYLTEVQHDGMDESWRRKIVRWMFEVCLPY
jgi:hypothetical protein